MEYESYDSSGTDDDLPPSHQNRIQRGGRVAGNGRSVGVGRSGGIASVPYSRVYGETDMESQIHQLEQEAYISVLRAFKAQDDAITWEKESLITELRKELRLSNEEHRELLGKVNADDVIRRIREWRQVGGVQSGLLATSQAVHDPVPSPSVSASRKKQKLNQSGPPQSFSGPSPSFCPMVPTSNQPSSSAARRVPNMGLKGKKPKTGQILPGGSSAKTQYHLSGPSSRGPPGNRDPPGAHASEPGEAATFSPLIGRSVRTRWPDDNNFYEAIITDYNPAEGRHALVYDMGTANETWEWVNLTEISPGDLQWVGDDPGISRQGGYGAAGIGTHRSTGHDSGPGTGRGRGLLKGQSQKDFPPSQNGIGKKGMDDIRLLHTDSLIKEVERVFTVNHPNPTEIEKAKKALKDHEQALCDAIARLANMTDGDSDEAPHFMHGQQVTRE